MAIVHSAHDDQPLPMQQLRILHHFARSFFAQPGHFPFVYDLQLPQYRPQYATRLVSASM
ncbi:MAG: hypothetical protein A2W92_13730 [Bacteroidetes bacterium GWA2_42_15]|nr:MAG: hypothetical protein A2W92_13730 [Bacteroidetes bacterium GWA2_42_15]